MRREHKEQMQRILSVLADGEDSIDELDRWHEYLCTQLTLPCEVTGTEDFRWEEFYVLGPGDPGEYAMLRKASPSYTDRFELMSIDRHADSPWSLCADDLKAHVRRKGDGRRFLLGLSELKATDRGSKDYEILLDYAVWFVNSK